VPPWLPWLTASVHICIYSKTSSYRTYGDCPKRCVISEVHYIETLHSNHHNCFTALFPGPPGWAGARRELLDFMLQGKINRGTTPSGLTSVHLHHPPPHFFYSPDVKTPKATSAFTRHGKERAFMTWSSCIHTYVCDYLVFCLFHAKQGSTRYHSCNVHCSKAKPLGPQSWYCLLNWPTKQLARLSSTTPAMTVYWVCWLSVSVMKGSHLKAAHIVKGLDRQYQLISLDSHIKAGVRHWRPVV